MSDEAVDTENVQVGPERTPLPELVTAGLTELVEQWDVSWEQVAAWALEQAHPDERPTHVKAADVEHTVEDWQLGRAVRDAHAFVGRFRPTVERPDKVKLTITRGNLLAQAGIWRLKLPDGYVLPIDYDGDDIRFLARPGDDPGEDIKITDKQLYLHAPKARNDSWVTEDDEDED